MREGTIPTALGTVVTAGAVALRAMDMKKRGMRKKDMVPMIETAVLGFGLAHVVLGTIDLIEHRR
ncbi:asparagine synthase [Clostridium sp. CX1]|uniref:Asparagine synthase n=1 Tax=Clostridium tanneri TaxID=3037988 RepID=A0ABU4JPF5_9CLOT|nr:MULTISPECIES: asparagine synthase [unclassified Clostridium]MCT8976273.1 asparagine synthase [Clostridium sp. CX1]MDW8799838.1 asparagine synthase [Clostridium sp. A1-XYC3]